MTDITIPPEALEAAMREYNRARDNGSENPLHNACLAMLRAWPGMQQSSPSPWSLADRIILPLTETDDEPR